MFSGFMHKYYDWAAFESFVKSLYEGEGDVTVDHDVTEVDRYGSKRQTDVKITRRTRFHRFVTLVECKRWKEPVGRDRIDVLASSVEALGAQNGAIFTTTGFEEGAIAYAKGKGIELFVVRDLTDQEWGLPGRHISFYLHTVAAEFKDISMPGAQAIALVDHLPESLNLGIHLGKDIAADPDYDLFSVESGQRGPNLVGILGDAHGLILHAVGEGFALMEGGGDCRLELTAACEIDLRGTKYRQLRLPTAATRFETIKFRLVAHISQSHIAVDRGANLDFAVMIESYVTNQRLLAHRAKNDPGINFRIANPELLTSPESGQNDTLVNGSIMKVYMAPWVGLEQQEPTKKAIAGQLLRVLVDVIDGKPQLSLRSEALPRIPSAP